jgi:glycosyltransferase involved in cell wall biosynthesis
MTLVSVVIPCRNYGRFVGEAIESVLVQTHDEIEVVVVDYGSTDDTAGVVARYPEVRCLRRPNLGLATARNDGLATSSGAFVVFLDADDRLVSDAVSTLLACLQVRPECAFAYGHMRYFDANGPVSQRGPGPHGCLEQDAYGYMLRTNNPLRGSGAVLYRRDLLERIGGFDRGLNVVDDLDLHLRLARTYPICCNDHVVLLTRVHESSLSNRLGDMLAKAVAVQQRQRAYVAEHPVYERAQRRPIW